MLSFAATILLDGISYGMVLFLISVGLTITMGLMRVVNLAHGSFAMIGGYTAGYLTQAYWTTLFDFDLHEDDVFWCTADIGWITGHTYACYGPLATGSTMVVYEGSPDMPDWGRLWKIAVRNKNNFFVHGSLCSPIVVLGVE